MYLNEVRLAGNLGKEAEVKVVGNNLKVGTFSLGIQEKKKDGTKNMIWINLKAFGETADLVSKYKPGDNLFVTAKLAQNKWTDKNTGVEKSYTDFIATNLAKIEFSGEKATAEFQELPF